MDAASDMAEETKNPRKAAPRSMLYAVAGAGVVFFVLGISGVMAVKNVSSPDLTAGGLGYIIFSVFGQTWGRIALVVVFMALTSCSLAVMSFAIRVTFGMARDNHLPFAKGLSKVSARTKAPINAAVVVGIVTILILLINIRESQIIGVLISVSAVLVYLAYLGVVLPMLVARVRGRWPIPGSGSSRYFGLGRWGLAVNIGAGLWLVLGIVNLAWPRQEIYNAAPPFHWYLKYGAFVFSGGVLLIGGLLYGLRLRHRTGVVAGHAPDAVDGSPTGELGLEGLPTLRPDA
jgi:amino acid transporter